MPKVLPKTDNVMLGQGPDYPVTIVWIGIPTNSNKGGPCQEKKQTAASNEVELKIGEKFMEWKLTLPETNSKRP